MTSDGLVSTATWIAAVRAQETARADRLLDDPWAAELAGPQGAAWLADRAGNPVLAVMTIRARFFDDFLLRIAQDGVRQVVLPGAGLDTRAFRLDWPDGVTLIELDRPEVLASKRATLDRAGAQPRCRWIPLGADLAENGWPDTLRGAGFDPRQPSCWLLEGFLFYLPSATIDRLLDQITQLSAPGSGLGFDIPNAATLTHPVTRPWIELQAGAGAPWLGTMDDPAAALTPRGWRATAVQPGEPGAEYGRWPFPVLPRDVPELPRTWLVTAHRD